MDIEIITPECNVDVKSPTWSVLAESETYNVDVSSEVYGIELATGVLVGGTPYNGEYEARALFSEQVFPTAMKTMREDFSVHAINYYEAPNDSGVTVTIGG